MRYLPGLAALSLTTMVACYSASSGMQSDASVDTTPVDVADVGGDDAGWSVGPDKPLVITVHQAALPDIAYTGSAVGMVYRRLEDDGGHRVMYQQLDATGGAPGPSMDVFGERLASPLPRISHDGDGRFLVSALDGISGIVRLAWITPAGTVLSSQSASAGPSALHPLSAPVHHNASAFVLMGMDPYVPGQVRLVRFPLMGEDDLVVQTTHSYDGFGFAPHMERDVGDGTLVTLSTGPDRVMCGLENIDPLRMTYTGRVTGFATNRHDLPSVAQTASCNTGMCIAWSLLWDESENRIRFSRYQEGEVMESSLWWEADAVNHLMDSDATDEADAAMVLSAYREGSWRVMGELTTPAGYTDLTDLVTPGDATSMDHPTTASVARTSDGFLIVWDEYSTAADTYIIASTFVADL